VGINTGPTKKIWIGGTVTRKEDNHEGRRLGQTCDKRKQQAEKKPLQRKKDTNWKKWDVVVRKR